MGKRLFRVLLICGLAVSAALIVLEATLRVFPEIRPSFAQERIESLYKIKPDSEPWWVHDGELGFLEKPLREENIVTIDYSYTRKTDRFGFANSGTWPEKADIVFLGDSLLSGVGVGINGQITTLVSDQLPDTAVVNLALPGSSPQHLLRIYRRFGATLHPKVVIACLYVASDVDNAKHFDVWNKAGRQWAYEDFRARHYLEALAELTGGVTPPSKNSADDSKDEERSGLRKYVQTAVNASALGKELLYLLEPVRKGVIHDVSWPDGSRVFLYHRFQNRLRKGIGVEYPSISDIFFGPLDELRRDVESDGAKFVVALIPSKEEIFVHPDDTASQRLVDEVRLHLDDLGMEVLDLYPAIRKLAQTTAPYYPHDIHFNKAGNEAVAAAIADWLQTTD